jgi:signal transduction histidine kinase
VASHDLQEPLRKIRTFGERLQMRNEDRLDGRSLDYIARMNNAAERMQQLIADLLTFSRVTTESVPFETVDLNLVAQGVTADLEARIEQVAGQVIVTTLPTIEADPLQMQQLLQNLVGNALKFHRKDVPPVVTITGEVLTKNGRKQARLSVADNGIGIADAHLDTIFEMFQRLHGRSDYEGTGIGLSICRRIVDRHGGTIAVESQPGKGTTFIVTLPINHNQ